MYGRPEMSRAEFVELANRWRPYRMWATVLLRMGWGREFGRRSYRTK